MWWIIVGIVLVVYVARSSLVTTKSERLFHKRKIIRVELASGKVYYQVKVNGFLGLPFLWQIDKRVESEILITGDPYCIIERADYLPSLDYARRWIKDKDERREKKKREKEGKKVIKKEKVK